MKPIVKTPLPGPRAKTIIDRDSQVTSPSLTRSYPLVVERGEGCWIYDVDGNRFLDFTAGVAVCVTGHCHPAVVSAIQQQSEKLIHFCGSDFYYEPFAQLSEVLARLAPGESAKAVYLCNSGTESVEAAMKLARYTTGRDRFIAFKGAFHGRTLGALSLNASKSVHRKGFGTLLSGVHFAPYPKEASEGPAALSFIEDHILKSETTPDHVAAIFVEAIQGEGGYVVPPDDFLPGLRQLCDQYGILLVVDEVQSGIGRTGTFFACEHSGVSPDIVCFAKAVASGLPLGGIIARAGLMKWGPGAHASTFGGNPVACAAALATIDLVENGLMTNAAVVGRFLMHELKSISEKLCCITDVRGRGLMIGIEFGPERDPENGSQLRDRIIQRCFECGLLLLPCGRNVVRICPPLTMTEEEAQVGIEILASVIESE